MISRLKENALNRHFEVASIFVFVLASLRLVAAGLSAPTSKPVQFEDSTGIQPQANGMPNQGWAPLTVYFSAFGSSIVDGKIVKYEWDLDANGVFDTDATLDGGYTSYTYAKPGQYTVTLRLTDEAGRTSTDAFAINVRHPASSSVDYWTVFDDSQVRRVDILLTKADWDLMWSDPLAKIEVNADAIVFGERLDNVGFRMRGQGSLDVPTDKKPWKINVDAYVEGQEYHNLKQLMFINSVGDPSMLQEKLAYEMMHFAGLPASHVAFVELWFDFSDDDEPSVFWGVYTMIERVDKKFLANRFDPENDHGNLYKASILQRGPMDLVYYGDSIEDYPTQNGLYAFGKATNEEEADYSDILNFVYVIDGVEYETNEDFAHALEQVFNVDSFLRYMAVVVTIDSWDIYPNSANNYYLFNNPATGKFEWIPWDLSWRGNPQQPLFELEGPRITNRVPLYDKVFQVEHYRQKYAAYVDLLTREWFTYDNISERAKRYHTMIAPSVPQGTGDKMYFGESAWFPVEVFEQSWVELAELTRERNLFIRTVLMQDQ